MTSPDVGCFNPSMGILDKLKQSVAAAKGGEVDRSTMTPEQLAQYDAQMARVAESMAQGQAGYEQSRAIAQSERATRVLSGPAGEYLYGAEWYPPSPQELERIRVEQGMTAMIKASQPPGGFGFAQAVGDALGRKKGPKEIDDPQQRAQISHAEWSAREAARAPYRATGVPAVSITRLSTEATVNSTRSLPPSVSRVSRLGRIWSGARIACPIGSARRSPTTPNAAAWSNGTSCTSRRSSRRRR